MLALRGCIDEDVALVAELSSIQLPWEFVSGAMAMAIQCLVLTTYLEQNGPVHRSMCPSQDRLMISTRRRGAQDLCEGNSGWFLQAW